MSVQEIVVLLSGLAGVLCLCFASVGVLRLPDFYSRMHAATRPGILGISLLLLGGGIYAADVGVLLKVLAIIGFFVLTTPVATHMLSRAAYLSGIEPAESTETDDLAGAYHRRSRVLHAPTESLFPSSATAPAPSSDELAEPDEQ